jgi:hypothetical protein
MPNGHKWFDNTQPQTLQGAVILAYITAVFGLIAILQGSYPIAEIVPLALGVAGYGIANEKKWAYGLGVALSGLNSVLSVIIFILVLSASLSGILVLASVLFAVILFALLVHPQSRAYQRIWFK